MVEEDDAVVGEHVVGMEIVLLVGCRDVMFSAILRFRDMRIFFCGVTYLIGK